MNRIFHTLISALLSGHRCAWCQTNQTDGKHSLCLPCCRILPRLHTTCYRCARPLSLSVKSKLCGACLASPPPYHRIITPFAYQDPIKTFIHALKFQKQLSFAPLLAKLMQPTLEATYHNRIWPEALLPIPLHKTRLRERGFNQALEIASSLAALYKIPLLKYAATRVRKTAPQAQTPASLREKNIKGAFHIQPLNHKHIAIIDDVVTTGHTVRECSRHLGRLGVEVIDVWCVARTIL